MFSFHLEFNPRKEKVRLRLYEYNIVLIIMFEFDVIGDVPTRKFVYRVI